MTEKDYAPKHKESKKMIVKTPKENTEISPVKKEEKKIVEKKEEVKKTAEKKTPKQKKTYAVINAKSVPISTLDSVYICKFIRNKKIDDAINYLELVILKKKAIPMKGEIPHRKGKGMMSGRFPKKSSEHFIRLLKSLKANSNANGLENPFVAEAIANMASRPYGRAGIRRKRTHIQLKAKERKTK